MQEWGKKSPTQAEAASPKKYFSDVGAVLTPYLKGQGT